MSGFMLFHFPSFSVSALFSFFLPFDWLNFKKLHTFLYTGLDFTPSISNSLLVAHKNANMHSEPSSTLFTIVLLPKRMKALEPKSSFLISRIVLSNILVLSYFSSIIPISFTIMWYDGCLFIFIHVYQCLCSYLSLGIIFIFLKVHSLEELSLSLCGSLCSRFPFLESIFIPPLLLNHCLSWWILWSHYWLTPLSMVS